MAATTGLLPHRPGKATQLVVASPLPQSASAVNHATGNSATADPPLSSEAVGPSETAPTGCVISPWKSVSSLTRFPRVQASMPCCSCLSR